MNKKDSIKKNWEATREKLKKGKTCHDLSLKGNCYSCDTNGVSVLMKGDRSLQWEGKGSEFRIQALCLTEPADQIGTLRF